MDSVHRKAEDANSAIQTDESPVPLFGSGGFIANDPSKVFQSEQSARWMLRQHARRLVEAGALLLIAGRYFVVPSRFRREVVAIGRDAALAKVLA